MSFQYRKSKQQQSSSIEAQQKNYLTSTGTNYFNKENMGTIQNHGDYPSSGFVQQQPTIQSQTFFGNSKPQTSLQTNAMLSSVMVPPQNYPNTRKFGREISNFQPTNGMNLVGQYIPSKASTASNTNSVYAQNPRYQSRDLSGSTRRQTSFISQASNKHNNSIGDKNSAGGYGINNNRVRGSTADSSRLTNLNYNVGSSSMKMDLEYNNNSIQLPTYAYADTSAFIPQTNYDISTTTAVTSKYNNFTISEQQINEPQVQTVSPQENHQNNYQSSIIPNQDVNLTFVKQLEPILITPVEAIDLRYLNKPEYVPQYAKEIFDYLRASEEKYICKTMYFEAERQPDLNSRMRTILIDWLIDVHLKFDLLPETLFLTVNIIDRYLENGPKIEKSRFQLVGIAALFIACKYEEIYPPEVKDFTYVCDNAYSKQDLFEYEGNILQTLQFNITTPSAYRFLERYARIAEFDQKCFLTALYFLEMTLVDYSGIKYTPSQIACSSILISSIIHNRKDRWSEALVRNTKYEQTDLILAVEDICEIHRRAESREKQTQDKDKQLNAVKRKYSQPRFECVFQTVQLFFVQAQKFNQTQ